MDLSLAKEGRKHMDKYGNVKMEIITSNENNF